jgi:hypothetical protein
LLNLFVYSFRKLNPDESSSPVAVYLVAPVCHGPWRVFHFSHNRELEARGKPRKLAGKVKGGGARCAERGACEELGEDCDADDDNDDADCGHMATMPQATAKLFPRNQLGGRVVS